MIFLLGGNDLEMCAIKRLLKKYNKTFFDKNLKWGAKLSAYEDIIKQHKNDTIYAIELEKDVDFDNVILIDHHNEFSQNPSSIEQVAEILGHKLSRFEKAVAINDTSYIDGLVEAGFNKSDIKRIRALDRKAQGVDEKIEKAAQEVKLDRIIEFNYEHFSPLNDRIFFEKGWKKYIIFNDNLTMFYGFDVESLIESLKKNGVDEFFYGGGKRGFLGVERKLAKEFLEKAYEMDKKVISHHIFMFPFVIERKDFVKDLEEKGWESLDFKIDRVEYFNEFVYFYEHVRDVLYGLDKNGLVIYKEKKIETGEYIIKLKNSKVYSLEIEDISLRIFNNSIGILSFHLNNYDYDKPYEILDINEYGRRIFPQFLDEKSFVEAAKETFLADEIIININKEEFARENFNKFNKENFENLKEKDVKKEINKNLLPDFIKKLVGEEIKLILDDRMFVVSFYLYEEKSVLSNLMKFDENQNQYRYTEDEWWYKYVFVDGKSKTCQSKIMCKEIVKNSTYDRWVEYGTLWGVSRYSFVGIGTWDKMVTHTKTMYYQMMVLLLMYRAMIVYFSDKVQDIVENIQKNDKKEDIRDKSKELYGEYLKFLNGLYFKEVTAQEQGIELYKKALKIMEIEEYIKDFDREISELDNYIEIEVEKERNEELDKLNKLATLFLPPTFIASFLGMNVGSFDSYKEFKFFVVIILMFLSIIVSEIIFLPEEDRRITDWISKKFPFLKGFEKYKWHMVLAIILFLILIGLIGGEK